MAKHTVLNKTFKNQKELKKYVKGILDFRYMENCNEGRIYHNDDEFKFMIAFLSRHPRWTEKEGIGISYIIYTKNINDSYDMTLYREDHSTTTISWDRCVHKREKTEHRKKIDLYRLKVSGQIREFASKNSHVFNCTKCNIDLNGRFEVDHLYPFTLIVQDYERNFTDFCKFAAYHKLVARYQILCVSCNREKSDHITDEAIMW